MRGKSQVTTDPNDQDRAVEYYKQLGAFVSMFAQVESHLFFCLILASGVSFEVGKAIFSGVQIKVAIDFIRRIFQVKKPPETVAEVMESCFKQLRIINDLRNQLLHSGVDLSKAEMKSTNKLRALLPEREISYSIDPRMMYNMTQDLIQITLALNYCTCIFVKKTPEVFPPVPPEAVKGKQRTWLYIPPAQTPTGRKTPGSGRK